ncbi:MAG TPA: hypothetical protein VH418_15000 [Solirubrobacteraceae bacterium]|jgi:hypothetical protein
MELLDPVTGAHMLDRMIAEAARYRRSLCLVRLHMPSGHIVRAAERVRPTVRDADLLMRWTDEDLLAVLPETDILGAEVATARICDAVGDLPVAAGTVEWQGDTGDVFVRRANAAVIHG